MSRFLGKEVIRFALLMLAVSFATFALVAASPIDPVQANVGQQALMGMSAVKRAELARYWGADVPLLERYVSWMGAALHGDFGMSLRFDAPVAEVIGTRFLGSLALMATSWVLSGVVGLSLGVLVGVRRDSGLDRSVRTVCIVLSSTPAFWLGMVALMVFSVHLGWFPLGFSAPVGVDAASVTLTDRIYHLMLPALVLSLTGFSTIALHTREKTIEVMASEYVRFARSRGENARAIVLRHGLRNLALPALTLQCASVGELLGGSVLVEQVFSYPGLGQAAVTAGLGGDAPLLVGIALASAALVFFGNFCADVLYGLVDPRMREGRTRDGWL